MKRVDSNAANKKLPQASSPIADESADGGNGDNEEEEDGANAKSYYLMENIDHPGMNDVMVRHTRRE